MIIAYFKNSIKDFFVVCSNYRNTILSLSIAFIIGFVSYNAFIVYNFASPDGILEGFHYYIGQGWAIAGCGRWFLALLNILHFNLVLPWLTILECILVNWLSAHTLCKIFKINNKTHYLLVCALFGVLPTFIEMYLYTNSAFSYCISVLFSILFVYFNLLNNKYLSIVSAILLGCAMGSYQSQIGVAVGLTVMCLVYKLLNKEKDALKFIILSLISGVLGLLVYVAGLKFFLKINNLVLFSRASTFSLSAVLINFLSRFIYTYKAFFETFNQIILKRRIVYLIFFVIMSIEIVTIVIKQINEKEYLRAFLFLTLIILLPPAINIIGIILPSEPITQMMLTPNYIILPFTLGLGKYINSKVDFLFRIGLSFCIGLLIWTYVLSANATYDCYRMSYNVYHSQYSNAIDKVLELEDYKVNSTKIVVIGSPNDSKLRENIRIYNYAIHLYNNLLYWNTPELDTSTTKTYIMTNFGIDSGTIEYDEYEQIINLQECLEMPIWPKEGSVKMVNNYAVIKFGEVYE